MLHPTPAIRLTEDQEGHGCPPKCSIARPPHKQVQRSVPLVIAEGRLLVWRRHAAAPHLLLHPALCFLSNSLRTVCWFALH